jgi:hypothetical protein
MVAVPPGLLSDAGPEEAAERYLKGVQQYSALSKKQQSLTPQQQDLLAQARGTDLYKASYEEERGSLGKEGHPYGSGYAVGYLNESMSHNAGQYPDTGAPAPADLSEGASPAAGIREGAGPLLRFASRSEDFPERATLRIMGRGTGGPPLLSNLTPDQIQALGRAEATEAVLDEFHSNQKPHELIIKSVNERDDEAPTPKEGRPKKKAKPDRSGPGGKFKPARTREQYTE